MTTNQLNVIEWHPAEKILFRFVLCYSLFFLFPFPLHYIPFVKHLSQWVSQFWQWLSLWTAEHVFHITEELPLSGRGSGDTTLSYIMVFNRLILSVLATLIWSVFDRKRADYRILFRYLILFLRYSTAFTLLSYGLYKVMPSQFSNLSLFDLIRPYGDSSPMGLMWNFMGYSGTYTIFSGVAEVIAGILLLFRPTVKLGAIISFGVMLNVFMMNMSYDIPVKIYSFHIMFSSVVILTPHLKSLVNFFILNKTAHPQKIIPYTLRKKLNIAGYIFKGIFIIYVVSLSSSRAYSAYTKWGRKAPLPPLYGIYNVQNFIINGDTIPPLMTDTIRWKKLVIDKHNAGIVKMDDKVMGLKKETDTLKHKLTLTSYKDSTLTYDLSYSVKDSMFYANGIHKKDTLQIEFKRTLPEDFLLINRGFHWINEFPFNR
ncbi:hypothetical protein [Sinomicrobium weinanense]|uniref:DoxX family protein n=1 Tax=Sinomicrobium weinanense TaxID=2842200 RepID=A0A926JRF6_9FLAO|nr:hypothetical protein [Sinomicrobium weinanense]MBC9795918.1 hypothetical protein [Sinomicrobium weinanense]MBU3124703.1 hypothetical protein [Sinomicrobium weinanense]